VTNRGRLVFSAIFLVALAACGRFRTTSIKDVLENPAAYEGRSVRLEGTVVDATNLMVLKFYHLEDATGRIAVVARKAVPLRGARVAVAGTVHQAFAIGDQNLTVVIEDP
jgi:hypothetical protein